MKPWILAIIAAFVFTLGLIIPAAAWETTGFRTAKGKLIHTGMLANDVLGDAGEPLHRQAATRSSSTGKSHGKSEVWTYRGADGLYALTFQDRRLIRIEVKPARDF